MMNSLLALGPWAWFALGVLLFVLETVLPGVHFLWFGLAAMLVCGLTLLTGLSWASQLISFVALSLLMVFLVRRYARAEGARTDEPDLNVRGVQYIGRRVLVEEPIVRGRGKVRVGDTVWQASGPDSPKGAQVRVVGCDGTVLEVDL